MVVVTGEKPNRVFTVDARFKASEKTFNFCRQLRKSRLKLLGQQVFSPLTPHHLPIAANKGRK